MYDNPLMSLGMLVAFAVFLGFLGGWLRLPRVTSYLLSGVILGPSVLKLVSHSQLHHFLPIADLAMALVLFNLGSHFSISRLVRIRRHIIPVAIGDILCTSLFVTVGLWLFGVDPAPAILLGCLAMATAPATTVLVLKDLRSEGSETESAQALVAINNLATIIAFELLMLVLVSSSGGGATESFAQLGSFAATLAGSVGLGLVIGMTLSFSAGFLSTPHWLAVLLGTAMFGLGMCEQFPLSYMLVFLVTGFVYSNTAQNNEQDLNASERVTALLCVAFFAIHGAELRLDQFLQLGAIGTAYIVLRSLGKYVGIRMAASWSNEPREMRDWLGATMLSQAGAAIALSASAVARDPETSGPVQTIILGSVIVFEILGPLLIRSAVVNSGEVPIAHVARHSSLSFRDQVQSMWWKLKTSLGADPRPLVEAQEMTVASLARSRIAGIPQTANFDEVISHIEHSHDNTFPVVNTRNQVAGIIRYQTLSETLFDPAVVSLVCAEDIATPVERVTYLDESATEIFDFFQNSNDDCIPIISREPSRQMEGVVRRADLRNMMIRKRKKGSGH